MAALSQAESERICKVFFAYIKMILHRTARDYIRSEYKHRRQFLYLDDFSQQELENHLRCDSSSAETIENYHLHLRNELLADIVPEFSETDRDVLFFLYYRNMTTVELAEMMGVSQQAVSKRKTKMLRRLANGS
jgi:RNA polymerase sigma factor (sigma-70 family)